MALFIYLLLGAIIITYEVTRKRYFTIDIVTFFNFFFFLIYSLTPSALILSGSDLILNDMPYGKEYFGYNPITPYVVFSAYLFYLAGFHTISFDKQVHDYQFKFWWSEHTIKMIFPFAYALIAFFFIVYINGLGGLMKAIELADAHRSGVLAYNKFEFVIHLLPLNTILLYYAYYKYFLEKSDYKPFLYYFIASILFVILLTVIKNSRGFLIFQLAGLYILTVNHHKNYFFKYLIPTLISVFIIVKYGKPLFNSMQYLFQDGFDAFIAQVTQRIELKEKAGASIISYFTHPIVSLEASLVHSGYDIEYRYFRDIVNAFLLILPNELLGIKEPEMLIMEQNTIILQGRDYGIVLPAILGLFSYSGNTIGVFIGSYLYGLLGVIMMRAFINIDRGLPGFTVFSYLFTFAYGYFVFRGVPAQVLNDNFVYIVVIIFLLFASKLKISKTVLTT